MSAQIEHLEDRSMLSAQLYDLVAPPPPQPVLAGPTGTITDSTPTFTWAAVAGADHYDIRFDNLTTGELPILRDSNLDAMTVMYTPANPLTEGVYRAYVRAIDVLDDASAWSTAVEFTLDIPAPQAPVMTDPIDPNGATSDTTPTFAWSQVADAARYDLWVNNITTGMQQVIRQTHLTDSNFTPTTNMAEGNYEARVRAVNSAGEAGAWSAFLNFTVNVPTPSAPTLIGPSHDVLNAYPTFVWDVVANATHYDLWVNNLTTNEDQVIREPELGGNSFTPDQTNPLPQGNYRVWVRAGNAADETSDWSVPLDFTIDIPTPLVPDFTIPNDNITAGARTLIWDTVQYADRYELQIDNVTTGDQRVIHQTNLPQPNPLTATTSFTPSADLAQGEYQARVRAFNTAGEASGWSTPFNFIVEIPTPDAPVLLGPAVDVADTTPTFNWDAVDYAVQYDLWINNISTGEDQVIREPTLTDLSFTPTEELPQGTYQAFVRAINSANETGDWSAILEFTIDIPTPAMPNLVIPADTFTDGSRTIQWDAVNYADHYELWIDNVSTGEQQVIRQTNLTMTSFTPTSNLPEGDYQARVRAINTADEIGDWSTTVDFTIDIPTPAEPVLSGPNTQIADVRPVIDWSDVQFADHYDLWVSNITTGEDQLIRETNLQTTDFTPVEDLAQGDYRAWVRAINSVNESSDWSMPLDFSIDIPVPSAPTFVTPDDVFTDGTRTIQWDAVTYGDHYELVIDNVTTGEQQVVRQTNLMATSFTPHVTLAEGDYQARVRAINSADEAGDWSTTLDFTINVPTPAEPVLRGPNTEIADVRPIIEWSDVEFADHYDLWVNNVTTGEDQLIRETNLEATNYTPLSDLDQGEYQVWVRAINSVDESSDWSTPLSFTIDIPTPGAPLFVTPDDVFTDGQRTIHWDSVAYAVRYDLWIDNITTGEMQIIRQTNLATTSFTPTADLPEGQYTARVRAINSADEIGAWSANLNFTVDVPIPVAPVFDGPSREVADTTPTFDWQQVEFADHYDLWVNNLTTGQSQVIRETTLADPTFTAMTELPQGDYQASVRAINSAGEAGLWSAALPFTIDIPTPLQTTVSGPTGAITTDVPTFTWLTVAYADHYDLWVDNTTTGETQVVRQSNLTTAAYTPTSGLMEGEYRARVRAINSADEAGLWSEFVAFQVDVPTPAAPVLTGPSREVNDVSLTFTWNGVTYADHYDLRVDNLTTGEDQVIREADLMDTMFSPAQDLPEGSYRTWVRAVNSVGEAGEWSQPLDFVIDVDVPLAPAFSAPSTTTTDSTPILMWDAVPGAVVYDLWVDNATTGKAQVIRQTDLASPTFTPTNVLNEGTYQAYVRGVNSAGEAGEWSAVHTFAINVPTPAQLTLNGPSLEVNDTTPTITWNTVAFAEVYDLWVDNLTTGQEQIVRETSWNLSAYTFVDALSAGTYRTWVRAVNSVGETGRWSEALEFTVEIPRPEVPKFSGPTGVSTTAHPVITWVGVANADHYDLWVNSLTTDEEQVIRQTNVTNDFYSPNNAMREGSYMAYVRAYNSAGEASDWSAPLEFTVNIPTPKQPVLQGPDRDSDDTTPTIVWSDVAYGDFYDLWVDDLTTGESQIIRETALTEASFTPTTDLKQGDYQVWVRAINGVGEAGRWSDPLEFHVEISSPVAPTLSSPIGTVTSAMPTLTWEWVVNGFRYDLWVDNVTTGEEQLIRENNITELTYTPTEVLPEGDYRAWVRAYNSADEPSPWSGELKFRIDVPTPNRPVLVSPAGITSVSSPEITWEESPYADHYDIWIDNVTTSESPVIRNTTIDDTSYTPTANLTEGDYRVWLRAINTAGEVGDWSTPLEFTVEIAAPAAPNLTGPSSPTGTTSSTTPAFTWDAVINADHYDLWVNNLTTRTDQVIRQEELTETTFVPTVELTEGEYKAWVRAVGGDGEVGDWSMPLVFTVDLAEPTRTKLTAPISPTGVISDTTPRFAWSAAANTAVYDLWVNNVTTGQEQVIRQESVADTMFTPTNELPAGEFQAWVRGVNSAGEAGDWSPAFDFVIDIPVPAQPRVVSPTTPTADATPTFAWDPIAHVERYDLWVNNVTTGENEVIRETHLTDTTFTPIDPLPEGTYEVWVRGINIEGEAGEWSNAVRITLDIPVPAQPTIAAPFGTVTTNQPTIEWNAVDFAARYEIWADNLTTGAEQVIHQQNLETTSFTPDMMLAEGTYRVWVRAANSAGEIGEWSAPVEFIIDVTPIPGQPQLNAPVGEVNDRQPTFSWTNVAYADHYDLWVDFPEIGEDQFIRERFIMSNSYTSENMLPNGTYRAFVRAINIDGEAGEWSKIVEFEIRA